MKETYIILLLPSWLTGHCEGLHVWSVVLCKFFKKKNMENYYHIKIMLKKQNENEKRRITQIKLQGWNAAVEMGGAVMLQSVHAQWTLSVTCMLKTTH